MSIDEKFRGTAIIVWFSDGKQKYKMIDDESTFDKELTRIRETVPERAIFCLAVNWTTEEVMTLKEDADIGVITGSTGDLKS